MSPDHPSNKQLLRWTAGKGRGVTNHVVDCRLCESRLEALTELAPQVRSELEAAVAPPSTFERRLQEHLKERLLNQETLAVLGDLFDVGPEMSRLLFEPEPEDDENDG